MKRAIFPLLLCVLLSLAGCSGNDGSGAVEPTAVAVATASLAPVVVATNTYIPIIEVQPTSTPTATPPPAATATPETTATPTDTPITPIGAVALEPLLSGGLAHPTFITHAFDERLFVLEQIGRIRIIEDGALLPDAFLDITDRVGSVGSEQGLLGLAFHPNYATPGAPGAGTFYVNYTDYSGDTHISRFSVLARCV